MMFSSKLILSVLDSLLQGKAEKLLWRVVLTMTIDAPVSD